MAKKRIQKIPSSVKIKCPHCGKKNMIAMPKENIYFFDCKKCKKKLETPPMKCCIVCAYSASQCLPNLLREAHRKHLEIRYL